MTTHAKLSPSGADRWLACPGSVALESGMPDSSSEFAEEGTAAHFLGAYCLENSVRPLDFAKRYILLLKNTATGERTEDFAHEGDGVLKGVTEYNRFEVTDEMVEHVTSYVDTVLDYAKGHELLVEQRLSIAHLTGEEGARGTSDAVILTPDEIQIIDLKYGMGVRVDAESNKQLMIYALAALREFEMLGEFKRVRLVIHQPRLQHLSEWVISVADLLEFAKVVDQGAHTCTMGVEMLPMLNMENWSMQYLQPGEKQCRFCKAKATCPSLREYVIDRVTSEFDDITQPLAPAVEAHIKDEIKDNTLLANLLGAIDLIETWCKAIRGRADGELRAGNVVPGYKLVQGRKGDRAWTSAELAEETMKSMRLKADVMYTRKVISPTATEKLLEKDKPKCWARIVPLITQSDGGLSVAPESDKRDAVVIQATVEQFEDMDALEGLF